MWSERRVDRHCYSLSAVEGPGDVLRAAHATILSGEGSEKLHDLLVDVMPISFGL
jgi:hypothetical protein